MVKFLSTETLFSSCLLTIVVVGLFTTAPSSQATEWDWQPRESLTEEQQSSLNQYCRGSYIDQWQTSSENSTSLLADFIQQDKNGSTQLKGAAEVQHPSFNLKADLIESTAEQNYLAQGNTTLRQKGLLITGSSVKITKSNEANTEESDEENNEIAIKDSSFLFHKAQIRGEASSINSQQGVIFIKEGFYTTCEPGNGSWRLYGSAIELDSTTGFGTAEHIHIQIAGIPVFYFPWLRFPIDNKRHSGFLFPDFGYSDSDGLTLSIPYYLNLSPTFDATITSNYVEKEGEGIDVEFRHLNQYGSTTFEQSTFDHNDEGLQITRKLESSQKFNDNFAVGLLAEDNPTEDLYPEENTTSIGEQDNYERSVFTEYNKEQFSVNITHKRYQTPDDSEDKPFEWQPRVTSSYQYDNDWLSYSPNFQYTDFYDPDESETDGIRQTFNQTLSTSIENQWGYVNPGLLHQYRSYNVNDNAGDDDYQEELDHTSFFFDSGLIFERSLDVQNSLWRQTLEPKLSYLNAPYTNQDDIPNFDTRNVDVTYSQAFSHTRFTGNDRIGDTEQFTLGLESHFYDDDNVERWSLKLGQIFYLEDRLIVADDDDDDSITDTDTKSAILSSISYNESELVSASLDLNYNTEHNLLELGLFSLQLAPSNGIRFDISHLYSVDSDTLELDTKESQLSTILPLTDNVHFFYQQNYDWIDDTDTTHVVGFGFENCCIKASASYQRWLDDDDVREDGFYLQFILRSLSNVGSDSGISSVENDYWNEGNIGYK